MRAEERRLRMAPEVMGNKPGAVEEDRRFESRIRGLAHLEEASPEGGDAA